MSGPIGDISRQYYIQKSRSGFELKRARWYSRLVCFFTGKKYFSLSETKAKQLALYADTISQKTFSDMKRASSLHQIVSSLSEALEKGSSESVTNLITTVARHALPGLSDEVTNETVEQYADIIYKKIAAQARIDEKAASLVLEQMLNHLVCTNPQNYYKILPLLTEKFGDSLLMDKSDRKLIEILRDIPETQDSVRTAAELCDLIKNNFRFLQVVEKSSELSTLFEKIPPGRERIRLAYFFPNVAVQKMSPIEVFPEGEEALVREVLTCSEEALEILAGGLKSGEMALEALEHYSDFLSVSKMLFPASAKWLDQTLSTHRQMMLPFQGLLCTLCREIGGQVFEEKMDTSHARLLIDTAKQLCGQDAPAIEKAAIDAFAEKADVVIDAMIDALERGESKIEAIQRAFSKKANRGVDQLTSRGKGALCERIAEHIQGRRQEFIEIAMRRVPFSRENFKAGSAAINKLFACVGNLAGPFIYDETVAQYVQSEAERITSAPTFLEQAEQLEIFLDKVKGCEFAYTNFDSSTFTKNSPPLLRQLFMDFQVGAREEILVALKKGEDVQQQVERFSSICTKADSLFPRQFTPLEDRERPELQAFGETLAGEDVWAFLGLRSSLALLFPVAVRQWGKIQLGEAAFQPYLVSFIEGLKEGVSLDKTAEMDERMNEFMARTYLARDFVNLNEMLAEQMRGVGADIVNARREQGEQLLQKLEECLTWIRSNIGGRAYPAVAVEIRRCVGDDVYKSIVAEHEFQEDLLSDCTASIKAYERLPHFGDKLLEAWVRRAKAERLESWPQYIESLSRKVRAEMDVYPNRTIRYEMIRHAFRDEPVIQNLFPRE